MSRITLKSALMALSLVSPLASATTFSAFPPNARLDDGSLVALSANLAWDNNHRESSTGPDRQADDWRRQEVGLVVVKPGVFDLQVFYDLHNEMWLGVVLGVHTPPLPGVATSKVEIGNIKLAAGLEGVAPTRHMPFMESAAATQVFHPMVRGGINWGLTGKHWMLDIGVFERDIDGFYDGSTQLLRAAWSPTTDAGAQGHLGLALSRDQPTQGHHAGQMLRGGTARWAARGVASLLPDRLADSGMLTAVDSVYRQNLQGMWIDGPLWLQGEYFFQQTRRDHGLGNYHGNGGYLSAGWVLNAPSRRIVNGMLMQPAVANGAFGAELVARYGQVDLDDAGIAGGRLGEWTLGANGYVGAHIKLQANLSQMHLRRAGDHRHTRAVQLRTQFFF